MPEYRIEGKWIARVLRAIIDNNIRYLWCTEQKIEMELREAFIEGENEPFREADVFGEVEIAGDGGFNLGTDAPFDHTANLITLQVSSVDIATTYR